MDELCGITQDKQIVEALYSNHLYVEETEIDEWKGNGRPELDISPFRAYWGDDHLCSEWNLSLGNSFTEDIAATYPQFKAEDIFKHFLQRFKLWKGIVLKFQEGLNSSQLLELARSRDRRRTRRQTVSIGFSTCSHLLT